MSDTSTWFVIILLTYIVLYCMQCQAIEVVTIPGTGGGGFTPSVIVTRNPALAPNTVKLTPSTSTPSVPPSNIPSTTPTKSPVSTSPVLGTTSTSPSSNPSKPPSINPTTSTPTAPPIAYNYHFVSTQLLSFQDAQIYCNNICQSDLASIPSDAEYEYFSKALNTERSYMYNNHMAVWMGLTDYENEGTFKYRDNTPYDINKFNINPWLTDHPHNVNGAEDCVAVIVGATDTDDKWEDTICTEQRWFVCNFCIITNEPTSNPTVSPITIKPSISPTNNPITSQPTTANPTSQVTTDASRETIWYQAMNGAVDPANWTVTASKLEAKQGINDADNGSDCPMGSVNGRCWALCGGEMYREASTIGYTQIGLTYSIDPWAMLNTNEYCQISWSVDENTWTMIDRRYSSSDEIVQQTEYLQEATWDTNKVYIKIEAQSGGANCCYMADWRLSGILILDESTTTDPTTAKPSVSPTNNPITSQPTDGPTTDKPTDIPSNHPTTAKPTLIPTNNPITTTSTTPITSKPIDSTTTSKPVTSATYSAADTTTTDKATGAPTNNPITTTSTMPITSKSIDSTTTSKPAASTTHSVEDTTRNNVITSIPTDSRITGKPTTRKPTDRGLIIGNEKTTKHDGSGQADDDEISSTKTIKSENGNSGTAKVGNGLNMDDTLNYVIFGLLGVIICLSMILVLYCIKKKRMNKKKGIKETDGRQDSNESGIGDSRKEHKLEAITSNSVGHSLRGTDESGTNGAGTRGTLTTRQITGTGTNTASTGSTRTGHIELEMEGGLSNKHGTTLRRNITNIEAEGNNITRCGYGSVASADSIDTQSIPINPMLASKFSADSNMMIHDNNNDDANSDNEDDANSNAGSDGDNVTKGGDVLPHRMNMTPMGPENDIMGNNYYSDISMAPSMSQQAMPQSMSTKGGNPPILGGYDSNDNMMAMRKGTDSFNNYVIPQFQPVTKGNNIYNGVQAMPQGMNGNKMDIAPPSGAPILNTYVSDDANSDNDEDDNNNNNNNNNNNDEFMAPPPPPPPIASYNNSSNDEHNGLLPASYTTGGM